MLPEEPSRGESRRTFEPQLDTVTPDTAHIAVVATTHIAVVEETVHASEAVDEYATPDDDLSQLDDEDVFSSTIIAGCMDTTGVEMQQVECSGGDTSNTAMHARM